MTSRAAHIVVSILLCTVVSLSAQIDFSASVNSTTVAVDERFTVEFSVNVRGQNFTPPNFNGFQVLGGPNTSMSTYMDNTGTRFKMSYGYTLIARSKGTYTIAPAFIKHDGKTYKTEPLTITVTDKKPVQENSPEGRARKNVYFKPLVSKRSVYQGEPIYARYKVFFRNEIGNPQLIKEPEFTGFYKEEVDQDRITTESEVINGERFNTASIRELVLIPQKSGNQKPGAVEMTIPTSVPTGRYDFFGRAIGRRVDLELKESFPVIKVKPLPLSGKPAIFSGAVGNFDFEARLSQSNITTDESVTLTLELKGTGNIKLATLPEVEFPAAFEVFDPEREESSRVGSFGMRGQKKVEYLLVPRYSGTYKIGPISFSFFNPKTGRYQTLTSQTFEITVTGGQAPPPGVADGSPTSSEKEAVKFIGKDILFIKTELPQWQSTNSTFLGSTLFYALFSGLLALALGLIAWYRWQNRAGQNPGALRQQKAAKMARKHLASAKKALKTQNADAFYQALASALWGYFGNKLGMPPSQLSKENIAENLRKLGVQEDTLQKALDTLNAAEMARYTSAGGQNPQEDYEATANLLTEIEKQV